MKLMALKPLRYRGAPVRPGEIFPARRRDVRMLQALGRAEVAAEPPPPEPDKPRRAYKRRDIEPAETMIVVAPVPSRVTVQPAAAEPAAAEPAAAEPVTTSLLGED